MSAIRAAMAVLAVLFGGGFLVLLGVAVKVALRHRAWRAWRRVPASITSVGWESRPEQQGVLRVVFEVEGRSATALDVGDELHRDDQREGLLATFAQGTQHEALVDPSGAPVLVTGLVQRPLVPLVIGLIFAVLSGVMAALAWYFGQPDNLLSRLLG